MATNSRVIAYAITMSLLATGGALIGGAYVRLGLLDSWHLCCRNCDFNARIARCAFQLSMYTLQIVLIATETLWFAYRYNQWHFYVIGCTLLIQRALLVTGFLNLDSRPH